MKTEAVPISVTPPPFFRDHHVRQRPVFPAVETMERLAADIRSRFPNCDVRRLSEVRFDKFLYLDDAAPIAASHAVTDHGDGSIRATLATRFTAPAGRISRSLEHAAMTFGTPLEAVTPPPLELAATLAGVCTTVDPVRIYADMVPFGPAYRNIHPDLLISRDGALARVGSPQPRDPRTDLVLGSPYVLDAAFHAACVWCQRFCGCVAFPVSMQQRTVNHPTRLDATYTARVVPVKTDAPPFWFDIFIHDDSGRLCEAAVGVQMRDISGGRSQPPQDFIERPSPNPLERLETKIADLIVMERKAVAAFGCAALSKKESQRLAPMTPERAAGYLSARLALKRLSRRLSGDGDRREARAIETVAPDQAAPQCPLANATPTFCSVAHDRRFTVAAAARRPVGVDVEPRSKRALKAMHLYMHADEQAALARSPLAPADGALRAWSAKEAAAKALGMNLAAVWSQFQVQSVAEEHSLMAPNGGGWLQALHAEVEGHLFTLVVAEEWP